MDGDSSLSVAILIIVLFAVLLGFVFFRAVSLNRKQVAQTESDVVAGLVAFKSQTIIKTYKGSQTEATKLFQVDSIEMAAKGYFPVAQSWAPGQWGCQAFLVAFLLSLLLIGLIVFIYMLIVKPDGALTVTYGRRVDHSIEEKTCPMCAERIKVAALVCHFCGHKF